MLLLYCIFTDARLPPPIPLPALSLPPSLPFASHGREGGGHGRRPQGGRGPGYSSTALFSRVSISSFWRSFLIVAVDLCRKIYLWRRCLITCDAVLEASPPSRPFSASKSSAPTSSRRSRCSIDSNSPPATPLNFSCISKE